MSKITYEDLQFTSWRRTSKRFVQEKIACGEFVDGSRWRVTKRKKYRRMLYPNAKVSWSVEISDKHDRYVDHLHKGSRQEMLTFLNEQKEVAETTVQLLYPKK